MTSVIHTKAIRHAVSVVLLAGTVTAPVMAAQGDWLVRGRVITVAPNDSSSNIIAGGADTGSKAQVDDASTLELDFTYMITDNIGAELILATTNHDIKASGGGLDGLNVGSTGVLPPTLTAQYHFSPDANIRPYAGVGVNFTYFYSEDVAGDLKGVLGGNEDMTIDPSFGLSAQAGVDIDVSEKWFVNLDVKYISISTTAEIKGDTAKATVDVDIDPYVYGLGIGTRF